MKPPLPARPEPASVTHDDHIRIEPIFELRDRAFRPGTSADAEALIEEAERRLAALKQSFPDWMAAELERLETAWKDYLAGTPGARATLFRRLHDVRGQASTFGFPLAGQAADKLCKLMDALPVVSDEAMEAHLKVIRAIVRSRIMIDNDPPTLETLEALDELGHTLVTKALKSSGA